MYRFYTIHNLQQSIHSLLICSLIWLITWGPYEVVLWSHYSACKYADYPREVTENIMYNNTVQTILTTSYPHIK